MNWQESEWRTTTISSRASSSTKGSTQSACASGRGSKAAKRRKARGTDNLPGIIVAVHTQAVGTAETQALHRQYTVLSEFGVLNNTWKVDELVPLSLNNFPQLLTLLSEFSLAQRMTETHADARPINLDRYLRISIEQAWKQHRARRKPATKSARRLRATPSRSVAVAAETALIVSRVDRRKAPSLFTVSSQPASAPPAPTRAPRIIKILAKTGKQYKVQWDDPPGHWTRATHAYVESYEENREVLEEWEERSQREELRKRLVEREREREGTLITIE